MVLYHSNHFLKQYNNNNNVMNVYNVIINADWLLATMSPIYMYTMCICDTNNILIISMIGRFLDCKNKTDHY